MKITEFKYVILNKPEGYVSALKDNLSPTIFELVEHEKIKGLHIVGRLDKDTTGIIILTNDGTYTHNATHPKKHINKVYEVTLLNPIKPSDIKLIEEGMHIDHGQTKLKPGQVQLINDKLLSLTISEGKFHQVKKMFAALDNEVLALHRTKFDGISLKDSNLKKGEYIIVDSLK